MQQWRWHQQPNDGWKRRQKSSRGTVLKASLQPLHPERLGQEETREAVVQWLGVLDSHDDTPRVTGTV